MIGVYVIFDTLGSVLYIGASRDVDRRIPEHYAKPWWDQVGTVKIFPMSEWDQALYVERGLIAQENPEHNRQGVDPATQLGNRIINSVMREFAG